ncbi:NAD(P)/FAD-dependent oxidoreductase [Candidatus Deferrimicrobium sp.]|uniref:NAD(P)/FAD-dependent oxidoreductase n=1 Tax=Candidatus Deferrimicrobium sp. TaxID=3060586 RepID=UPI0027273155|nr:NAD(P)/FAD-dependent oxidoreductase [Candidatus Deferrimicrobium sp.]MDO8738575.1 NAD(P)/FAD-dependent oxidoreductase [Candidatus Deferrimicrobium sp.]
MPGKYELIDGSVVAIIGGGPAGCSCAIKLRQLAEKKGISLRIILFERKDFNLHHNQCVGVLSPPIEKVLKEELSISIPQELIKRKIMGYHISSEKSEILLRSNNEEDPTYAVRRVKFDKFILDEVIKRGIEVIHSRVTDIEFIDRDSGCEVKVYSESSTITADVVVGAFGLDEGSLHMLEDSTRNRGRYVRPRMVMHTFITKVHPDSSEFINEKLGDIIHAFLLSSLPKIEFGAITPKGDHIIVNIAGEHVTSVDLENFLKHPAVAKFLPPAVRNIEMVSHKGHFPTSPARNPYGDRYITVGDSTGWLRPFKGKGITTAVMTGISAAKAMMNHGISKRGLDAYAAECEYLTKDYPYGTLVRYCSNLAIKKNYYDFLIEYAKKEDKLAKIFYDSVSGHRSYKDILFEKGNFRLFAKLGAKFVGNIVGG